MDAELTALATTAATTVVTALTTDAWQQVRGLVARLWRHPDRTAEVETELEEARRLLLDPARTEDQAEDQADLIAAWRLRFRRLIATDEAAARALAELVTELTPAARPPSGPDAGGGRSLTMNATANDSSQLYQSGGDMTIGRP